MAAQRRRVTPQAARLANQVAGLVAAAALVIGVAMVALPDALTEASFRRTGHLSTGGTASAWALAGVEAAGYGIALAGAAAGGHVTKEVLVTQIFGMMGGAGLCLFAKRSMGEDVLHEGPLMGAVMGYFMASGSLATALSVAPDLAALQPPARGSGAMSRVIRVGAAALALPFAFSRLLVPSVAAGLGGLEGAGTPEVSVLLAFGALFALQTLLLVVAAGDVAPPRLLAGLATGQFALSVTIFTAALGSHAALGGLAVAHAVMAAVFAAAATVESKAVIEEEAGGAEGGAAKPKAKKAGKGGKKKKRKDE